MAKLHDVIIVGGGLAGLCCATHLQRDRRPFLLLEAADAVGGRIRTDRVDGFLLDRGFQVFLPSYPEARQMLDYPSLNLHSFYPGSLIRYAGKFYRLADLWRRPTDFFATLFNPALTLPDKLRIARLRANVLHGKLESLFHRPESTTLELLQKRGFSSATINHFFKPFFGGVFLENELKTSSRHFEFLFRMFSQGQASLPAEGMEAIPRQLASNLPASSIRTDSKVIRLGKHHVELEGGETIEARAVVVAVDGPAAARLIPGLSAPRTHSVSCLYYSCSRPPIREPILVLNGEGKGPINNLCLPSNASPTYAAPGQSLISVTVLDSAPWTGNALEPAVRQQLQEWFGTDAQSYQHLKTCHVHHALPEQIHCHDPIHHSIHRKNGFYLCGDYCENASINGAMLSGRHAALAVMEDLK